MCARRIRAFRGAARSKSVVADREERLPKVRPLLDPIRNLLKETKWFGGDEPNQVDFMMLGHFLWCLVSRSARRRSPRTIRSVGIGSIAALTVLRRRA